MKCKSDLFQEGGTSDPVSKITSSGYVPAVLHKRGG